MAATSITHEDCRVLREGLDALGASIDRLIVLRRRELAERRRQRTAARELVTA